MVFISDTSACTDFRPSDGNRVFRPGTATLVFQVDGFKFDQMQLPSCSKARSCCLCLSPSFTPLPNINLRSRLPSSLSRSDRYTLADTQTTFVLLTDHHARGDEDLACF